MTPKSFVDALAKVRLPSVFNPYSDRCAVYDHPDAAERRKFNLKTFLEAALDCRVDTIWIAPRPRLPRRTPNRCSSYRRSTSRPDR